VQRDKMRDDPLVRSAIATAWAACAQGENVLSKDAYHAMSRRLYLVLAPTASKATIHPDDWRRIVAHDFEADSGGKGFLTRDDFAQCWFQLVDLHTEDVSSELYASWVLDVVEKIAHKRVIGTLPEASRGSENGTAPGKMWVWKWRDDLAVLSRAGGLPSLTTPKRSASDVMRGQATVGCRHRLSRPLKKEEGVKTRLHSQVSQIRLQWESSFKVERSMERQTAARRSADAAQELNERLAASPPSPRKHRFRIPGRKHARLPSDSVGKSIPTLPLEGNSHPPLQSQETAQLSKPKMTHKQARVTEQATCALKQHSWRLWRPRQAPKGLAGECMSGRQSHKREWQSFMAPVRPVAAHAYQVLRRSFHL